MKIDWTPLKKELAALRRAGVNLPLWWRDDDAVTTGRQLDRLNALSEKTSIPVYLAAIPDLVQQPLVNYVSQHENLVPVVHGWRHENHSATGKKQAEFGQVSSEGTARLNAALVKMSERFGARLFPMFVPPWNRIDTGYFSDLPQMGYAAVSTFGPRTLAAKTDGLLQINTHIDPIEWRGSRDLVDPKELIAKVCEILGARRMNQQDPSEPFGYLTHHLVHSEDLWVFSEQLLCALLDGGAEPQHLAPLSESAK